MEKRKRLLTVAQVADRLGVAPQTVRRWADQGFIPVARTPGGQRRFDAEQIEAFAATITPGPLLSEPEPDEGKAAA
jgi:excisionase family DNA binding protein